MTGPAFLLDTNWVIDGKIISDFDLLIAASALAHNLILLTNDRRHFENVEGLVMESVLS